ncbi:MAG: hypothetical protein J7M25_11305 [Deltaproteobacteria bacterium]|nr:hypothetical protein [Deltaproteobacteria bacterium]
MQYLFILLFLARSPLGLSLNEPRAASGQDRLARAIIYLAAYHGSPIAETRAKELAGYFRHYGAKWHVDPWLAASIACQESIFRNYPRKVKVRRCRTIVRNGRAVTECHRVWAGERGMMQVIFWYVRDAYRACTGKRLKHASQLVHTETNICVGTWLMAQKRNKILARMRAGRPFVVRGAGAKWSRRYRACSKRQRHFCRGRFKPYCDRLWWVASYNWGSHQLICGRTSRAIDYAGYPIRVIRRYVFITHKFQGGEAGWAHGAAQAVANEAAVRASDMNRQFASLNRALTHRRRHHHHRHRYATRTARHRRHRYATRTARHRRHRYAARVRRSSGRRSRHGFRPGVTVAQRGALRSGSTESVGKTWDPSRDFSVGSSVGLSVRGVDPIDRSGFLMAAPW